VVLEEAPFVDGVARVAHECCDCALVHHVLFWVIEEGGGKYSLGMRWERDDRETRKRRLHKFGAGWDRDPWNPRTR
jgi:hypothetical protein